MKSLILFLFFSISISTFSQLQYIEIPQLTKKVSVKGSAIKFSSAVVEYFPEYEYKDGVAFGTYMRVHFEGVQHNNILENEEFIFYKQNIVSKDGKNETVSTNWMTEKLMITEREDDETLYFNATLEIGSPLFSGEYVWEIELADFCSGKKTVVSIPMTIVNNPGITIETSKGVSIAEAFLFNEDDKYNYSGPGVKPGMLSLRVADIKGFKLVDNTYKIGVATVTKTEDGEVLYQSDDLAEGKNAFQDPNEKGLLYLKPYIELPAETKGKIITYELLIWDKNQKGKEVKVSATFKVM
jgi:hypothetical protein